MLRMTLAVFLVSTAALAESAFADRGQFALFLSGNRETGLNQTSVNPYPADHLSAGALWFFRDGLAAGASLEVGRWSCNREGGANCQAVLYAPNSPLSILGIAPEIAWNARLGSTVTLLLRLSMPIRSIEYPSFGDNGPNVPLAHYTSVSAALTGELLIHLGHLFIGVGPRLSGELRTPWDDHATSVGLQITLGGWILR
jgi:hypothetical protein